MKYLKWIIMFVIVIIIILIIILYKNNTNIINQSNEVSEVIEEKQNEVVHVTDSNSYYTIKIITEKYINSLILKDEETLYDLLSKEYITEFEINKDEVLNEINILKNDGDEDKEYINYIDDMLVMQAENIYTYFCFGHLREEGSSTKTNYSLMVQLDTNKNTFCIYPDNYIEKYGYNKNTKEYKPSINAIEENDNNRFNYLSMNEETLLRSMLNKYQDELVYNIEDSYDFIDEEYKKVRFQTIDQYKEYMKNNIKRIMSTIIDSYKKEEKEGYTQYVCKDKKGNYIIFKTTAVMQYTVMLDSYTLDLPEFLEQYNSTNNQGKTALNIQKFIQSINAKDYSYAYSKLADSFKNNYFKTEEDFEKYVKDTFFEVNKAEYGEFSVEGNVNTYEITLSDQTGENTNKLTFNIIMQLQEGTDFVMSFGT